MSIDGSDRKPTPEGKQNFLSAAVETLKTAFNSSGGNGGGNGTSSETVSGTEKPSSASEPAASESDGTGSQPLAAAAT